jgi:hypothetical protein
MPLRIARHRNKVKERNAIIRVLLDMADRQGQKGGSRATLLYKSQFFVNCRGGGMQRHGRC